MYKMVYLGPNGALTIEVPLYRTVVHYDQNDVLINYRGYKMEHLACLKAALHEEVVLH